MLHPPAHPRKLQHHQHEEEAGGSASDESAMTSSPGDYEETSNNAANYSVHKANNKFLALVENYSDSKAENNEDMKDNEVTNFSLRSYAVVGFVFILIILYCLR